MSQPELVTVTIDGRTVQVPKGMNLVQAAALAGVTIPVFCYHPKLDPAGLCRMCLVQIEKQPKPTTACTTTVADGMVVHSGDNQLVGDLRAGVLEFLLLNHPLDCPVCDKGGECDLQDLTFGYGKGTSRLTLPKEHKNKALDLGPFIVLDQERCILCRRCTRFDDEVAQESQLVVAERGHHNVVTTLPGQPYDHYFTGNVTELCPVGALTSDLFRFKGRPWDLSRVPGVCTGCAVGCNVEMHFRHGQFLRVINRDNPETDSGWLCDRGRFNYGYVHSPERLTQPLLRKDGQLVPVTWTEALTAAAEGLKAVRQQHGGKAIGLVGGGRLTLEEAYAFQRLGRAVLGTHNIDHRVTGQATSSLSQFAGRIADLDSADTYLVVDCLPAEKAPVADIRIRRGIARRRAKLVAVGAATPKYRARHGRLHCLPGQTGPVLDAVVAALGGKPAAVPAGVDAGSIAPLADILKGGKKIAIVWGGEDPAAGRAVLALAQALQGVRPGGGSERSVSVLVPGEQANSRGAAAMGVLPGYLPGFKPIAAGKDAAARAWNVRELPAEAGLDSAAMLKAAAGRSLKALYVAGANLALTWPEGALAHQALANVGLLIVQDLFLTETARQADIVFPAAPFAARSGHYAALDGLVQQQGKAAMAPGGQAQADGAIFGALATALGAGWKSEKELAWELNAIGGAYKAGDLLPGAPVELLDRTAPAPDRTATAGDLALVPVDRLYSGGGTAAFDPGLARVANQALALVNPADAARLELADGALVDLAAGAASIRVAVRLDKRVAAGTIQVPRHVPGAPVNALGGATHVAVARAAAEVGVS